MWRTIESAPRDGTPILLATDEFSGGLQVVGSWERDGTPGWECECHRRYHPNSFTHWKPLDPGPGDDPAAQESS